MTPEQYERIREIYLAACEKSGPRQTSFLDQACGDDRALRAEVESLLSSAEQADTFLRTPVLGTDFAMVTPEAFASGDATEGKKAASSAHRADDPGLTRPPERIGQYRILDVLGKGGMGVVYRAEQENPRRTVALKVIRPGVESREMLKRFAHESQILGWLQHPGIAHIFEAGTADAGKGPQPYFAMELIAGKPLTIYANEQNLGTRARLELLAKVCDAVHHAHQKGVIHRDLKPSNILVDGSGHPKVLDFGVARATDADIRTTTLETDIGQLIGTMAYMSPEQVAGDSRELDTRSDVYALGVICYELLTGRLPHDVSKKTIPQAARLIEEVEPAPVSSINRALRGDVETIITKALEKEKDRRYQSASEIADDIRRYLSDQPITARPVTTVYQLRKFARRNKALVAAVAIAFLVLSGALAVVTLQRNRAVAAERLAEQRREEAERQAAIAEAINDFLNDDLLAAVNPIRARGRDVSVIDVLESASEAIEGRFKEQPLVEAAIRSTLGETYMNLGQYEKAEPHLTQALALHQSRLGEEHVDTSQSLILLGYLYIRQGRYDEAEPLLTRSLAYRERALGEDDAETLSAKGALGVMCKRQGRYAEAERYYVDVLEARRRVLGNEHRHTIVSMNNLAILYRIQDKYDEAEALFKEALELNRRVQGADHPDTFNVMNSLAVFYKNQARFDEAEPLYLEVVEGYRRTLGAEHPNTLVTLRNLATLYEFQKRYDESESLYLEVLDICRRKLGDEHPDTLRTMTGLAYVYCHTDRWDKAEPLAVAALEVQRRLLGDEHKETLSAIELLGKLRQGQERHEEAVRLFTEELAGRRQAHGNDHRFTLGAIRRLSESLIALERFEEAETLALEGYERHRSVYGPTDEKTVETVNLLVTLYDAWDKPEKAAEYRALLPEASSASPSSKAGEAPES